MAYYFMVERKKGEYQALNIASSKYFQTIPRYKTPCALSLKEIDDFTMMFDNEDELRIALVQEGILPANLSTKQLSARNLNSGKYTKVEYEFLYQKDMEYVYDPAKLIKSIMSRYYDNELVFIKELAQKFSRLRKCNITASEVANLCQSSIYQNTRHRGLEELDKNGNTPVLRLLKLIVLKSYEHSDGYIEYKNEVEYRNLHDLIAFVNNYDKKNKQQKETTEKVQTIIVEENVQESIQKNIEEQPKRKQRKKSIYTLEGQLQFKI